MTRTPFDSIYRHGFVRLAIGIPSIRLGNPLENAERTLKLAERAGREHAAVVAFPELGLSGYSNEDLFHQDALLDATVTALGRIVEASRGLRPLLIVGAPLLVEEKLFNCAVAIIAAESSARRRRRISPTTASSTNADSSRRASTPSRASSPSWVRESRLAMTSSTDSRRSGGARSTSRSARTCGSRFRRAPLRLWPGPPCC